jgi:hypothetical protein
VIYTVHIGLLLTHSLALCSSKNLGLLYDMSLLLYYLPFASNSLLQLFCNILYIFQPSQSGFSNFSSTIMLTLKFFLSHPSLNHSNHMPQPLHLLLLVTTTRSGVLCNSLRSWSLGIVRAVKLRISYACSFCVRNNKCIQNSVVRYIGRWQLWRSSKGSEDFYIYIYSIRAKNMLSMCVKFCSATKWNTFTKLWTPLQGEYKRALFSKCVTAQLLVTFLFVAS